MSTAAVSVKLGLSQTASKEEVAAATTNAVFAECRVPFQNYLVALSTNFTSEESTASVAAFNKCVKEAVFKYTN